MASVENAPTVTAEQIAEALRAHWVLADKNLGQYRTEYTCRCGATWVYDGHNDARQPHIYEHQAEQIAALAVTR